jgi:hypothetical protein
MNQEEIQVLLQDAETRYNQAKENFLATRRDCKLCRLMQQRLQKQLEPN